MNPPITSAEMVGHVRGAADRDIQRDLVRVLADHMALDRSDMQTGVAIMFDMGVLEDPTEFHAEVTERCRPSPN